MLEAVFFTDEFGEILIEKNYGFPINRKEIEPICSLIKTQYQPPPLFESFGHFYVNYHINDVWIIGVTQPDGDTIMVAALLQEMVRNVEASLREKKITLDVVKIEFHIIYQILDLFIDRGVPFLDEENCIYSTRFPGNDLLTPDVPWFTKRGHKGHSDLIIKVIEQIQTRINSLGKSDLLLINGRLELESHAESPTPVKLSYSCPWRIENTSFHRCIDQKYMFSTDITFTPPNGKITLMEYSISPHNLAIPIFLVPKFTWSPVGVIFDIAMRIDNSLDQKIGEITVKFTLPEGISAPSLATTAGRVRYCSASHEIIWEVDRIARHGVPVSLGGSASVPAGFGADDCDIVVSADFEVTDMAISSMNVRIDTDSQRAVKNASYSTIAGRYIFDAN